MLLAANDKNSYLTILRIDIISCSPTKFKTNIKICSTTPFKVILFNYSLMSLLKIIRLIGLALIIDKYLYML